MDFIPIVPEQQRHLKELNTSNPNLDNISQLLIVPPAFDTLALKETVKYLHHCHDALCLRFVHDVSGWRQFVAHIDEIPVHLIDYSTLANVEHRERIESEAIKWQTSLNIFDGPLFRVIYFNLGPQQPGRLLLIFHHLIIDGFSCNILLGDFMNIYQQIIQGKNVHLQKPAISFMAWAERMQAFAQSNTLQRELENYWLTLPWDKVVSLPVDYPHAGWTTNTRISACNVYTSLNVQETQALLNTINVNTQIFDLLLAALALTITRWTNSPVFYMATVDHGRMIFNDINVSRTVGLLAGLMHLFLNLEGINNPIDVLKETKIQIKQNPHRGVGYGLIKYLSNNGPAIEKLQDTPRCEFILNYFGLQHKKSSTIQKAEEHQGQTLDMHNMRPQIIALEAGIKDKQLYMRWCYSTSIHRQTTIDALAQHFIEALKEIMIAAQ